MTYFGSIILLINLEHEFLIHSHEFKLNDSIAFCDDVLIFHSTRNLMDSHRILIFGLIFSRCQDFFTLMTSLAAISHRMESLKHGYSQHVASQFPVRKFENGEKWSKVFETFEGGLNRRLWSNPLEWSKLSKVV